MTTSELNIETIEAEARALLDSRVATVRELVSARQAAIDARTTLADAERAAAAAYAAAEHVGWSGDELQKLGLSVGNKRRPGRPRTRAVRPSATDTKTDAASAPEVSPAPQP